tara:strand:+ start:820 stop:1797 length:978 start_codon:yes stop_codon:yes gene_type:complete
MAAALPIITTAGKVAGAAGAVKGLMGGGSSTGQTQASMMVDPQTQAIQRDLYEKAQAASQQPFVPYTGPMVAGFSPDQLRAFGATRGMFERTQALDPVARLSELAGQPAPSLLGADISAYQSPFTSQVIEQSMQDIQRQADIARGGAQARAIGAGAFGGSRSALLESEAQRPFAEAMARTAAGLREAGFGRAQRAAESDIERQIANRRFQADLQRGLLGEQYRGLGLLGGIGGQQQALQQQAIAAARGEFQRALDYPQRQLGLLATGVSGVTPSVTERERYTPGIFDRLSSGLELYGQAQPFLGSLFSPQQPYVLPPDEIGRGEF